VHPSLQSPAVDLELRFAATLPSTDATTLTRKLIALSAQARKSIANLRQFDLRLTFKAVSVLTEDVQDDRGSINRRTAEKFFEVALLRRRQFVVEHHRVGIDCFTKFAQFLNLAAAEVGRWVRRMSTLNNTGDAVGACGIYEQSQFVEMSFRIEFIFGWKRHPNDDNSFTEGSVDKTGALTSEGAETTAVVTDDW